MESHRRKNGYVVACRDASLPLLDMQLELAITMAIQQPVQIEGRLDDVVLTTAATNTRWSTPLRPSEVQSELVKVIVFPDGDGCVCRGGSAQAIAVVKSATPVIATA